MSGILDRWHIAICKPGQDKLAERQLWLRKYRVFRPTIPGTRKTRWGGTRLDEVSMFPGYLFVQPNRYGWEMLRTAPGMIRGDRALLKLHNRLVSMDDDDPDFLIIDKTSQDKWDAYNGKPECPYKPGDVVRIIAGPWVECLAVIERIDKANRIAALIDMLGRKVRAYPDPKHLSLVSASSPAERVTPTKIHGF